MKYSAIVLSALVATLASCGGGGGGTTSTPAPAPSPSPTPTPTPTSGALPVVFLDAPATSQEFPAFTSGDPLRIRYDAATRTYEIMPPGEGWQPLYGHTSLGVGNYHVSGPMEDVAEVFARTRPDHPDPALRFHYSSLAAWIAGFPDLPGGQKSGLIAFGVPTPAGGVPVSGSGSYVGPIFGSADIRGRSGWGDFPRAPIEGTVSLSFDFGRGALTGEIRPRLACDCDPIAFPTLSFADTVFAAGSRTYSGRFATSIAGANAFSGAFTGPQAQELIGRWAFPFTVGGTTHAAEGVWAAKRD